MKNWSSLDKKNFVPILKNSELSTYARILLAHHYNRSKIKKNNTYTFSISEIESIFNCSRHKAIKIKCEIVNYIVEVKKFKSLSSYSFKTEIYQKEMQDKKFYKYFDFIHGISEWDIITKLVYTVILSKILEAYRNYTGNDTSTFFQKPVTIKSSILAIDFNVSTRTIEKSIKFLKSNNFIYSVEGLLLNGIDKNTKIRSLRYILDTNGINKKGILINNGSLERLISAYSTDVSELQNSAVELENKL